MLRNTAIATLIFSSTALSTTLPAHALTIARYDFGSTGEETLAPTTTNSDVAASSFGTNGITAASGGYAAGVGGNPNRAINYQGWALNPVEGIPTGVINTNKYYTFTITPNSGISMSFNTLTFAARRSGQGPQTIEVRASPDNYVATLSTLTPGNGNFNTTPSPLSTNLSGAAFQNLTTAVTFRIYGYQADDANGTLRLDNVVLDGTTQAAVPVPFGFTPIWGIAVNGVVFGLRKLRNKKSVSQSSAKV